MRHSSSNGSGRRASCQASACKLRTTVALLCQTAGQSHAVAHQPRRRECPLTTPCGRSLLWPLPGSESRLTRLRLMASQARQRGLSSE
jgi:hypothetical protein